MTTTTALAISSAALITGYAIGASGTVSRITSHLSWWKDDTLRKWQKRGPNHKITWWPLKTYQFITTLGLVTAAFTIHPIRSTRHIGAWRRVSTKHQPAELREAVAAYARLHFPADQARTLTHASFSVFHRNDGDVTFKLDIVPFYDASGNAVERVTMGTRTEWWSGRVSPDPEEKAALEAARDRVDAALHTLDVDPSIPYIRVKLTDVSRSAPTATKSCAQP